MTAGEGQLVKEPLDEPWSEMGPDSTQGETTQRSHALPSLSLSLFFSHFLSIFSPFILITIFPSFYAKDLHSYLVPSAIYTPLDSVLPCALHSIPLWRYKLHTKSMFCLSNILLGVRWMQDKIPKTNFSSRHAWISFNVFSSSRISCCELSPRPGLCMPCNYS